MATSPTLRELRSREWTKDGYVVSTNPDLIPIPSLNEMFASDDVYWTKPIPDDVLNVTVQNSLCFGLYKTKTSLDPGTVDQSHAEASDTAARKSSVPAGSYDPKTLQFIGIGRCITDFTTFIYLTDVHIYPAFQGQGLGKWLITCIQNVIETMPYLRRSMLITGDWKRSVPLYEKLMDMHVNEPQRGEGLAVLMRRGPGATV